VRSTDRSGTIDSMIVWSSSVSAARWEKRSPASSACSPSCSRCRAYSQILRTSIVTDPPIRLRRDGHEPVPLLHGSVCRVHTHGTDLQLGDLSDRIQGGVGEHIAQRLRKVEGEKDHAPLHLLGQLGTHAHLATTRCDE
jgi:hypothetical protein